MRQSSEGWGTRRHFSTAFPLPTRTVVLVEPADAESLEAALRLQRDNPGLPIVCASIDGPNHEAQVLQATTYLLKPFRLIELTDALELALSQSDLLSEVSV